MARTPGSINRVPGSIFVPSGSLSRDEDKQIIHGEALVTVEFVDNNGNRMRQSHYIRVSKAGNSTYSRPVGDAEMVSPAPEPVTV